MTESDKAAKNNEIWNDMTAIGVNNVKHRMKENITRILMTHDSEKETSNK